MHLWLIAWAAVGFGALGQIADATDPQTAADSGPVVTSASPTSQAARPTATSPSPPAARAPATPPASLIAMTCPDGGTNASPTFAHVINAAAPYTVVIDYGDGVVYRNDDQHLAEVFAHSYDAAGTFTVKAVVTDAAGRMAAANCLYTWTAPASASP
jgi:hypothetical protein